MPWIALAPRQQRSWPVGARALHKAVPDDPTWRLLHQLADDATPAMLRDVTRILGEVGVSLSREDLARLVSTGNQSGAEQLLRQAWDDVGERGLQETLAPRLRALALQAGEATSIVGIDVAFNVQDPEALAAIDAYTGRQITAISQTTREAVQGIVRRAFESGTPITQQINEIAELVGLTPRQAESLARFRQGLLDAGEKPGRVQELVERRAQTVRRMRAESISRTEGLNAAHLGQQQRWEQSVRDGLLDPTRLRRFWILGPRACPEVCAPIPGMNPDGVGLLEPFQTPVGTLMHPTAHPQCLPGDTLVLPGGRIQATSKRWYDGPVITLMTSGEKYLTCTPNHAILTPHGWMAARFLIEGNNIVCSGWEQRIAQIDMDIEDMPTRIKQIVDSFRFTSGVASGEVPIAAEAFHGDGLGSQVAIIGANRLLGNSRHATFQQHIPQYLFRERDAEPFALVRQGTQTEFFKGFRLAARRTIRRGGLPLSLRESHLFPPQSCRFFPSAWFHAQLQQAAADDIARDAIATCQELFRDSRAIQEEQLVQIKRHNFSGHVYNLQTELGWYISNGIITHNCMCAVSATVR